MSKPIDVAENSAGSSNEAALLVVARLMDIASDDRDFVIELVDAFVTAGHETLAELRSTLAGGDMLALSRVAHKLKGSSTNLHIEKLATLSLDLENRAKANEATDWQAHIEAIDAEFKQMCHSLRRVLLESPPSNERSAQQK